MDRTSHSDSTLRDQQHHRATLTASALTSRDSWDTFDSIPTSPLSSASASTTTPSEHTRGILTSHSSIESLVHKSKREQRHYSEADQALDKDTLDYQIVSGCSGGDEKTGAVSWTRVVFSFVGLFFTIFLSGLDQTITSTILTRISNDFRALDRIEWVPTIFMLCSTCLNVVSGSVADIFGRFTVLMFSLLAFITGALLAASSQSIVVFIVARGISGIACGGMLNLSIIIISDIVPIERRGRYLGFLQICFGASNAAGPLVGGLLADRFNWRAAFFADMIMGAITVVYLAVVLKLPKSQTRWKEGIRSLDYAGIGTIVTSISLLIVGLNLGGTIRSWGSPITLGCLISGCLLLCVFVGVELRLPRIPLVPMWIFTVRNLVIAFLVTFLCGMAMFSIIFYMPVYFSAVFGVNAMRAGLLVLPFGMSLSISSFISGYFMSAMSQYRLFLRLGPATMALGILLLALLSGRTTMAVQSALLVIPGIGMGNVIVANVIAAQASTDPQLVAVITPLCEFFLSIGGVIGVAVFGAVYRNQLSHVLTVNSLGQSLDVIELISEARRDVSVVYRDGVDESVRVVVARAYVGSMRLALWVLVPLLMLAFALSMGLQKTPVVKKDCKAGERERGIEDVAMEQDLASA
ncbi:hypothetical protein LPJ66_000207 [Kickxella alabastrina]|uniref:Uncharacterized protein n=1 Tax=Kickxella alabastrina TaxID=61397 RepID=A0ACC1IWN9_9FUNG|nr:hypothetical protein LPJ66_000207 [Kickxella alabastrina]